MRYGSWLGGFLGVLLDLSGQEHQPLRRQQSVQLAEQRSLVERQIGVGQVQVYFSALGCKALQNISPRLAFEFQECRFLVGFVHTFVSVSVKSVARRGSASPQPRRAVPQIISQ